MSNPQQISSTRFEFNGMWLEVNPHTREPYEWLCRSCSRPSPYGPDLFPFCISCSENTNPTGGQCESFTEFFYAHIIGDIMACDEHREVVRLQREAEMRVVHLPLNNRRHELEPPS